MASRKSSSTKRKEIERNRRYHLCCFVVVLLWQMFLKTKHARNAFRSNGLLPCLDNLGILILYAGEEEEDILAF